MWIKNQVNCEPKLIYNNAVRYGPLLKAFFKIQNHRKRKNKSFRKKVLLTVTNLPDIGGSEV